MLSFLRRMNFTPFDISAIGDHWTRRPFRLKERGGELQVRRIPSSLIKEKYRFVALVQPAEIMVSRDPGQWTVAIQNSLEAQGKGLLVLSHFEPTQVTWYAYASTRKVLDDAFLGLQQTYPVRWGINEDRRWEEYEFSRNLIGA